MSTAARPDAATERSRHSGGAALLAAGLVVVGGFLGVFYAYPLATLLGRGLTGGAVLDVFGSAEIRSIVWFTLWQAALSTLATLVLGLPVAHAISRRRFPGRSLLRIAVTVPFVLPTVVVATAMLAVADRFGLDDDPVRLPGTAWAIVVAHVFFNLSVVVRSVGGWWAQLDDRPEAAARSLGAGPVRTFVEVTLPRLAPALRSTAAIVFLFTFTSFGVVLILGGLRRATLETEIWRYATQRTDFETAAALGLVQLAVVIVVLVVNSRRRPDPAERTRPATEIERRPRGAGEWGALAVAVAVVVVVIGIPMMVLVERSLAVGGGYGFDHYAALAGDDDERIPLLPVSGWTAVANSVSWAALAMVVATAVGTVGALLTVSRRRVLARATDIVLLLPLGTSAVLVGFGMLIALDEPPLDIRSRWWIVPMAQAVVGVPFVMRAVATALRGIDDRLRDAAASLGASPIRVWREVDLPIVSRAVVVGAAFSFAVSVGEFGATSFLARPQRPTVPTAIFRLLGRPGEAAFGQAMALSVVLVVITGAAVLVIERLRTTVAGEL